MQEELGFFLNIEFGNVPAIKLQPVAGYKEEKNCKLFDSFALLELHNISEMNCLNASSTISSPS